MLVPDTIQAAATAANAEVVLAWLDAGNDVNSNGGSYSYNLLTATAMATPIAEANVALARELLRRGADPRLGNNHSYGQWLPLHAAARGQVFVLRSASERLMRMRRWSPCFWTQARTPMH